MSGTVGDAQEELVRFDGFIEPHQFENSQEKY